MGKGKLVKFAEMAENPLVVESPFWKLRQEGFALKGQWHADFFHNQNPIVLELGCGRGEYTVGLARRFPNQNFIGVDINIEFIQECFAADEVQEIWLTFSDPQMKKATKRLSSTFFLERYRQFLADGGTIHLKTDSPFLYTYTRLMAEHNGLPIVASTDDLYNEELKKDILPSSLTEIRTYYEQMWLDRGFTIKYLQFHLPHEGKLEEPNVEIPVDGYRSYNHEVRSTRTTSV